MLSNVLKYLKHACSCKHHAQQAYASKLERYITKPVSAIFGYYIIQ